MITPPPITLVGNVLTHFRYRIELQSSRICLNIRYISFKNKYLSQSPKNVMISRQLEANRNTCIKNNGRFLLIIAWEYCTGKLFIKNNLSGIRTKCLKPAFTIKSKCCK